MKTWFKVLRPGTLLLALAVFFICIALANGTILVKTLLLSTIILLQLVSNIANDIGDYKKGTDINAQRTDRALVSGKISYKKLFNFLIFLVILTFISGILLLNFAFGFSWQFLVLLTVGILAIFAALKYTLGNKPYAYSGYGDFFVFLFFGVVGVLGGTYCLDNQWILARALPAFGMGFLSIMVLNVNNTRDITDDLMNGKMTIPAVLGKSAALYYQMLLFNWTIINFTVYGILENYEWSNYLFLVMIPFAIGHLLFMYRSIHFYVEKHFYHRELKRLAIGIFFFSVLFYVGSRI